MGRPRLGLVCASIHTGASRDLWAGVLEETERQGIPFFCFPGGRLAAPFNYESQRNRLYDLAGPDSVDGLVVWTTSLEGFTGPSEIDELLSRLSALPVVSLHRSAAGAPLVLFDAYRGMFELMRHLLGFHGYERVVFIRGPSSHHSAEERFRAYREALAEYGLPYRQDLVSDPEPWDAGEEAIRSFLGERGLVPGRDFRALVGASDLLAFSALEVLQKQGFRIPAEVAVAGFNDSLESRLAVPPLSTVAVDFRREGAVAVGLLLSKLRGETVPGFVNLPTRLVLRPSCGCPSPALSLVGGEKETRPLPAAGPRRSAFAAELAAGVGTDKSRVLALIEALSAALSEGSTEFYTVLEEGLEEEARLGGELEAWQDLLSRLRTRTMAGTASGDRKALEKMFHGARVIAAEAAARARARRRWAEEARTEFLGETGSALLTARNAEDVCRSLAAALPGLAIPSAFVALDCGGATDESTSRLLLAARASGPIPLPSGGLPFPTRLLVPSEFLPRDRRYAYVVEPLFLRGRRLGHALLEIGPRDGVVYEELRGYLSGALEGARLLEEARLARCQAERADDIKTRLLANLSRELCAPLSRMITELHGLESMVNADSPGVLASIRRDAERQRGLIDDLLELSRAEIDELDLRFELMDPLPALLDVAASPRTRNTLPSRLPLLRADPRRYRRIIEGIQESLAALGAGVGLDVGAELRLPYLLLRFGLPPGSAALNEGSFVPFAAIGEGPGLGLGLALARRIAALHGGSLVLGEGPEVELELRLPLPSLGGQLPRFQGAESAVFLIGDAGEVPPEVETLGLREPLGTLRSADEIESIPGREDSLGIVWELERSDRSDWNLVRSLAREPRFAGAPLILFGTPETAREGENPRFGFTENGGLGLLAAAFPRGIPGSIIVSVPTVELREAIFAATRSRIPGIRFLSVPGAAENLPPLRSERAGLAIVELGMPADSCLGLVEALRADPLMSSLPLLILASGPVSAETLARLSGYPRLILQVAELWTGDELGTAVESALLGADWLPAQTAALAKRALVFLSGHFAEPLTRWRLAEAVGASEDYLTRIFSRELGISPWEFLNRYRVQRAKRLLLERSASVAAVGEMVGFREQAYFSRVFKKIAGCSPFEWRKRTRNAGSGGER